MTYPGCFTQQSTFRTILLTTSLLVSSAAAPGLADPTQWSGFDQKLSLQGIGFRVSSPNNTSLSPVKIETTGLALGDQVLQREADGIVTGAEVADLDGDGSPELYIYTTSAGSGSYGNLIGYAVNNGKSLSDIYLPPLEAGDDAAIGYSGHDEFAVVGTTLVRRFPLYRVGDTNAAPGGGTRQLQYTLEPGEAGRVLRLEKVTDY
ncbi:MAG: PliI family lysozyme inhibitor of I-type lysozyme [Halioglobus sp.]